MRKTRRLDASSAAAEDVGESALSAAKMLIFCATPFSSTVKSTAVSPEIGLSVLGSIAATRMRTRSVRLLKTACGGADCPCTDHGLVSPATSNSAVERSRGVSCSLVLLRILVTRTNQLRLLSV